MRKSFAFILLGAIPAAMVAGCGSGQAATAGSGGGGVGAASPTTTGAGGSGGTHAGTGGQTTATGGGTGTGGVGTGGAGAGGASGSSSSGATTSSSSTSSSSGGPDAGVTPCTTDADCGGGTTCQIGPDATGTSLELHCAPIVGPNGPGLACTGNAGCRSGLCVGGYCAAPCTSVASCTQAATCQTQGVNVGGLSGSFPLCVVSPCTSIATCDPGEVCSAVQSTSSGSVVAFCRQKGNGGPIGTTCTSGAACASLLCPSFLGSCTEVCGSDADCAAATGEICVDMYGGGSSIVQACAPGCARAGDCGAGKTCVFVSDTPGDRNRLMCAPPSGTGDPTGTSCATQNHCASGLCLSNYLNGTIVDQICTQPCVTSADCPVGYGACIDVQVPTPSGAGMQVMQMCDHP